MNFLLRTSVPSVPESPRVAESEHDGVFMRKPPTLEGLIAEDPHPVVASDDDVFYNRKSMSDEVGDVRDEAAGSDSRNQLPTGKHIDVSKDEGFITIPCKKLPHSLNEVLDLGQLQSLDRSFLFPGEQIHILVSLSPYKNHTETIVPIRDNAVSRNGKPTENRNHSRKSASLLENGNISVNGINGGISGHDVECNGELKSAVKEVSREETPKTDHIQMEENKLQAERLLVRFRNSHFFVRIAEANEPLWSKKRRELYTINVDTTGEMLPINAPSDKGLFEGATSGGVARDIAKCYALPNGDIVVLLRINVGVSKLKDPVLEVLQFEKQQPSDFVSVNNFDEFLDNYEDPCQELLHWLLPLDRTLPPPRSLSPQLNPAVSHKPSLSSSGSQIFSLGHFRSLSMPSLSPNIPPVQDSILKPGLDLENIDLFASEKLTRSYVTGTEGNLSFRGIALEQDRYSVRCGLEGLYLPGRRWQRKIKIIQPVEVHTYAVSCTADNPLSVLVKNIAPAHIPDIVIYVDAITIVPKEVSRGDIPLSVPIASIEVGDGHSLPIALRSGEEHSFILKPAALVHKDKRATDERILGNSGSKFATSIASTPSTSRSSEYINVTAADQYAVLVSYRCNYSESKLVFKQVTSWRPRAASDLMISVSSEPYKQAAILKDRVPQLPVQVLTLKATNLTSEDLSITVVAPEPSSLSTSTFSSNSVATTPRYPVAQTPRGNAQTPRRNNVNKLNPASVYSHLWLQSAVPLGLVPARSSASVMVELLPLTDGIISLDTIQIFVKEKGTTYVPEHALEIYATSSFTTALS